MKPDPPQLGSLLRETAARYGMFAPGQTVIAGVSGGPDSTALLHALAELRSEWGLTLVAAHLNHSFRGAEADADADYVAALADSLGIACRMEKIDVPALRKRRHLSAQEAARNVRRDFLRRTAEAFGAERIALGHTRDDRIETVLLNLLRGSGLEGLGGFAPVDLPIVRPLYDVSREQTQAYCERHSLRPRRDSSNADLHYRRNRIRTELRPYLASYYNARADEAIHRMAELAHADNSYMEAQAAESLERMVAERTETRLTLDAVALQALPVALRRRVVRQAVAQVRGHLHGIGFEILERVTQGIGGQINLPSGDAEPVVVRADAETVCITREQAPACALPWQTPLRVPGRTPLREAGLTVECRIVPAQMPLALPEPAALASACVLFALRDVTLPLLARSHRPGDRMRPRGLGGSKKLSDLFIDAKVSPANRPRVPIFAEANGEGRILLAGTLRADERALWFARGEHAPPMLRMEEATLLLCLSALAAKMAG